MGRQVVMDPEVVTPAPVGVTTSRGFLTRIGLWRGGATLLGLPLVFLVLCMAVPIGFVFYTAMTGEGDATFSGTLQDPLFQRALVRTILMAVIVAVICLVLGLVFALALAMSRGVVKVLLAAALGSTFVISLMVRTYGWVILMQPKGVIADILHAMHLLDGPLNLLQTQPAMYIGMVHVMLPYQVLLTYTALSNLDPLQLKAARSMGASGRYTFRRVVLPQIASGLLAGSILVFMISLSFYITPAFLGGPRNLTMGTLIGREMSQLFDFRSAAIMGSLLLLAICVIYLLAERFLKITEIWEQQR